MVTSGWELTEEGTICSRLTRAPMCGGDVVTEWARKQEGRRLPTEILQTPRGGCVDPATRLGGYTRSLVCGISQVWYRSHSVANAMSLLSWGDREALRRRMNGNPHVADAKACRAVLWWDMLPEVMTAARVASERRARWVSPHCQMSERDSRSGLAKLSRIIVITKECFEVVKLSLVSDSKQHS
ncbi:unnamed protein product [Discosporangium mesarthrocarpum]